MQASSITRRLFAISLFLLSFSLYLPIKTYATNKAEAGRENLAALENFVKNYAYANLPNHVSGTIDIRTGNLDHRLRLKKCQAPLQAFLPVGKTLMNTNIVGVKCNTGSRWSIYVPITITVMTPVIVAGQPIARGETLTADKLQRVELNISRLRGGYFETKHDIIGMVAKRHIGMGRPITRRTITEPTLVNRGESITIVAKAKTLKVSMPGTALMDGKRGQTIRVKNTESKRIVEGKVIKPGTIEIIL